MTNTEYQDNKDFLISSNTIKYST